MTDKNNDYVRTINSLDYLRFCYETSYGGARGAIESILRDCTDQTAIYYANIALMHLGFRAKDIEEVTNRITNTEKNGTKGGINNGKTL